MTHISDDMVEDGAKAHSPFAFEKDDDDNYVRPVEARDEARREVRNILAAVFGTAALEGSVAVPAGLKPADIQSANYRIGRWLSAALEDPIVCSAMKSDINDWFEAHPEHALPRQERAPTTKTEHGEG